MFRMGVLGGGRIIPNIFWGCLIFLIFFGVNKRCWVQAYVWKSENIPLGSMYHVYENTIFFYIKENPSLYFKHVKFEK